ncbi:MAG: DUF3307 domain-containing protein [bacterium]
MKNLLLLLITAHLISDFLLQSNSLINMKTNMKIKGFIIHGIIVFITTALLSFYYDYYLVIKYAAIIAIMHFMIDIIKQWICNKNIGPYFELNVFLIDQTLHIFSIYFLWNYIFSSDIVRPVFNLQFNLLSESNKIITINPTKLLYIVIFYIMVMFAGAVFLDKILNITAYDFHQKSNNIGRYIGIIERGLILTLVTFGSLSSLAFVLTAKSLARFNKLSDKNFAEYYLFGTLNSMFIALISGIILRSIL